MTAPPEVWRGAVCYESPLISKMIRETLDEMGWIYERDRTEHHYTRLMVAITMPSASYVFQYIVKDPIDVIINIYDEKPTHTGISHYVEIKGLTSKNAPRIRKFLGKVADKLPRKPYDFFWQERFRTGILFRDHLVAKREWGRWGI